MKAYLSTIKTLQQSNVLEIKFLRRRVKPGFATTRRMLCTGSLPFLNSPEGRIALNFRSAYNRPRYNPDIKNIAITWDIFMQDYRNINVTVCDILSIIPVGEFWKFFNDKGLGLMSATDKIRFMNS